MNERVTRSCKKNGAVPIVEPLDRVKTKIEGGFTFQWRYERDLSGNIPKKFLFGFLARFSWFIFRMSKRIFELFREKNFYFKDFGWFCIFR